MTQSTYLLKKADLCLEVSTLMLGDDALLCDIEDQAVALMHMREQDLIDTHERLSELYGDEDEDLYDDLDVEEAPAMTPAEFDRAVQALRSDRRSRFVMTNGSPFRVRTTW